VAIGKGISETVVDSVLDNVSHIDRVVELDRRQPEFTQTFTQYYTRRVTPGRVATGREKLAEHRKLLERVLHDTGVPPHYVVAFWGLETNFGGYLGKIPVPDSLTTLACDGRRGEFFTNELMAALEIIEAGDVESGKMIGSWAGAMGHVQFMPSTFLRYAVDADGDGRRDLWGSIPDAIASAGNFLANSGWVPALRWGREVLLPAYFDYSLATRDVKKALSHWSEAGVSNAFGQPLPSVDLEAAILVPAGANGPAFVTYRNFEIIMRWNRSEFYALSVGRLADRIAGAGALQQPPPDDGLKLSRDLVVELQRNLGTLGYDSGKPDGIFGSGTRTALREFQRDRGLLPDGYPAGSVINEVRDESRAAADR
jgi:membrane-bound lytic murein transglycosylase B